VLHMSSLSTTSVLLHTCPSGKQFLGKMAIFLAIWQFFAIFNVFCVIFNAFFRTSSRSTCFFFNLQKKNYFILYLKEKKFKLKEKNFLKGFKTSKMSFLNNCHFEFFFLNGNFSQFSRKKGNFLSIFEKKWQISGNFWTFNWQFSSGSASYFTCLQFFFCHICRQSDIPVTHWLIHSLKHLFHTLQKYSLTRLTYTLTYTLTLIHTNNSYNVQVP